MFMECVRCLFYYLLEEDEYIWYINVMVVFVNFFEVLFVKVLLVVGCGCGDLWGYMNIVFFVYFVNEGMYLWL